MDAAGRSLHMLERRQMPTRLPMWTRPSRCYSDRRTGAACGRPRHRNGWHLDVMLRPGLIIGSIQQAEPAADERAGGRPSSIHRWSRGVEGPELPLITTAPLSGVTCSEDGAWLPRTTAIPLSGVVCSAEDAWLPLITAGTLAGKVRGTDGACSPRTTAASVFGEAGSAGGARAPLSATALLADGGCGARAPVRLSASMLLRDAD